jgi:hypothetical protein
LTFNTLEATKIRIGVGLEGARSGIIYWDDINIEPAGLANVLRRELTPFVVKSADGKTVYEEGRDFTYVEDPLLGKAPMPDWLSYLPPGGSYDIWHEGPPIRVTKTSRIKDGEKLLVSYFHPHIVYGHQVNCSLEDPKVFDVFQRQMEDIKKLYDAPIYMMSYDEIREAGWENQPGGAKLTPGELLANHIKRAAEIGRKVAPNAKFIVWSDMFSPFQNARKLAPGRTYYLVNGSYENSWEGLPPDMEIMLWGSSRREALQFFTDKGHGLILSGASRRAVEGYLESAKGLPHILGFMYTTWSNDYGPLEDYSRAIDGRPVGE